MEKLDVVEMRTIKRLNLLKGPVSNVQKRIILDEMKRKGSYYNKLPMVFEVDGHVDVEKLKALLMTLVKRHKVF